jgi:hypothetical protein
MARDPDRPAATAAGTKQPMLNPVLNCSSALHRTDCHAHCHAQLHHRQTCTAHSQYCCSWSAAGTIIAFNE